MAALRAVVFVCLIAAAQGASLRIPRFPTPRRSVLERTVSASAKNDGYKWKEAYFTQVGGWTFVAGDGHSQ